MARGPSPRPRTSLRRIRPKRYTFARLKAALIADHMDRRACAMPDVLIGRQPIFDRRLEVHSYELTFRYGERSIENRVPAAAATARVLTDALTSFGLDRLVGAKPATVNVTRDFLLSHMPLPVDPQRLMLEI